MRNATAPEDISRTMASLGDAEENDLDAEREPRAERCGSISTSVLRNGVLAPLEAIWRSIVSCGVSNGVPAGLANSAAGATSKLVS